MKIYLLIILLTLSICYGNASIFKTTAVETVDGGTVNDYNLSLKNADSIKENDSLINTEYIDWDSVKINGKLPLITTTSALFQLLGQPDSIVAPDLDNYCGSYYEKAFKLAYFKGSQFEIYGDTAVTTSINLEKRPYIELKTQTLTLNHNTTLAELKKIFPNAVKDIEELDVVEYGKMMCVRLATSRNLTDDAWLLFFIKGKLICVDWWMPC